MNIRFTRRSLPGVLLLLGAVVVSLSAGRAIAKDEPAGDKPAKSIKISYAKHIAPILWKNCAGCHRPGEVGPFSLLTYKDAAKRAAFLAEITASRRMPPWKAEPDFGKFQDERRLTEREIAMLAKWAEAGAPEGNPKDLPKPPDFPDGWQLGEPDMVLKMPESFSVPASGRDIYRCFVIPIPIDNNKMVSGVEFRPGNRKIVHHAILFLDANGVARKLDGADGKPGFVSFGGPGIMPTGGLGNWVPGSMPRFLPEGLVKYVKKGSDLVLQIHYHPSGKEETDQSVLGLHFSKKAQSKIVTGIAVLQTKLAIPAGDAHCEIKAQTRALPVDVQVLGISPHMHNLGREFKATATLPGRTEETPLIWIKDWDFNWQGAYQFEKPIRLPKGSTINVVSIYDNSSANPKNPNNPPKAVRWGEQTTDEMCLCGVQVFTDRASDLMQIAQMRGNELGPGLEGGVPGQAEAVKKKVAQQKAATRKANEKKAAEDRLAKKEGRQPEAAEKSTAKDDGQKKPTAKKAVASKAQAAKSETSEVAVQDSSEEDPPRKEPAKDAKSATAAKKAAAPEEVDFPAEGIAIPDKFKQLAPLIDSDGDGKISRAEFERLGPSVKVYFRRGLAAQMRAKQAKAPAGETSESDGAKKVATKKPAANKRSASAPDEKDDTGEPAEPQEPAKAAKSESAKKVAGDAFPAEGIVIPENVKLLIGQYDTNGDGKISREEYDKVPPKMRGFFRRLQSGGSK